MKHILFALSLFILAGCEITGDKKVEPSVFTEYVYLIPRLPEDSIPKFVDDPLDLKTATQKEIAEWLIRNERRIVELETRVLSNRAVSLILSRKAAIDPNAKVQIIDITKEELETAK